MVLKERRRLVLMVRETPLHLGHLRAMVAVTEMGAVVFPPVPAFYAKPGTIADMVDQDGGAGARSVRHRYGVGTAVAGGGVGPVTVR